jgi:hypothetical protein
MISIGLDDFFIVYIILALLALGVVARHVMSWPEFGVRSLRKGCVIEWILSTNT